MTFEEFEVLPDPPTGYYELRHGEVFLVPFPIKRTMVIQQKISHLLASLLDHLGFMTMEFGFRPAAQYEYWRCDIGFVSQSRWDADDTDYFLGAPDLAVVVLSDSNTMSEMFDRLDVCLSNGCISFWMVDPKRRRIMVTTLDRTTITYDRGAVVPLPAPYQGSVSVAAIFP